MSKIVNTMVVIGGISLLSACTNMDYTRDYYSSGGYVQSYASESSSGYNRDYNRHYQDRQQSYVSTRRAGGGYSSSQTPSNNGGYSSSQTPSSGGYSSDN